MRKVIYKSISILVIVVHLTTVCFRDACFAASATTIAQPPGTLMPSSFGGTSVGYAYQTNSSTGKANLSLSFNVPPGRRGLQPSLAAIYENNQGNSYLGVGWSLDLGAISRSTKRGLPKYDNTDTYVFSSAGSIEELAKVGDDEYRPKIEGSFTRYIFNDHYWEAIDKSGTRYRFGFDSGSRQGSSGLGTFKWCLDRITDIHGNYISISYQTDQGEIYPYRIEYTGFKEEAPLNGRIEFVLEYRDDISISYRTKTRVVTAKRLRALVVTQKDELVRKYVFNYTPSPTTNRSLLSSVVQYGSDNYSSFPALTLEYSQSSPSWKEDARWAIADIGFIRTDQTGGTVHSSYTNRDQGRRLFDVNGDGLTDLIVGNISPYENKITTYLNTGSGFVEPERQWKIRTGAFVYNFKDNGRTVTDLNADGRLDPLISLTWNNSSNVNEAYLGIDGDDWQRATNYDLPDGFLVEVMWAGGFDRISDQGRRFADLNGDGLSDFIAAKDGTCKSYLNTGSGWQREAGWDLPAGNSFVANYEDQGRRLVDINADGLTDLLVAKDGQEHQCYLNTGSGFVEDNNFRVPGEVDFVKDGRDAALMIAELNGDGLPDLTCARGAFKASYINTGCGWKRDDRYNIIDGEFIDTDGKDQGRRLADINGDGITDELIGLNDYRKIYLNQAEVSDMLVSFSNGIAGTTRLTYKPSSAYDNTGIDSVPDLPFIIWTVSEVNVEDGLGNSYKTAYEYKDGYFDAKDREFRGFGFVKTIDADGNYSESVFLQDSLFKGRPYAQETKDAQGRLYAKSLNTWGAKEIFPGVKFVYPAQSDNYIYDADGSFKQTRVTYEYDQYGNPLKVKSFGDVFVTGDEKTQVTEYIYNTSNWLLSLPKHTELLEQNNIKAGEKWFYYDDAVSIDAAPQKGLLTKEEPRLYNPVIGSESRIPTSYKYDTYGNLISATDALGRTTSTIYDGLLRTYPISVTNSLGHSAKTSYDYHTGQVLTATDANDQSTTNVYDALGRLAQVIGPNDSTSSPGAIYEYDLSSIPIKITKKVRTNTDAPSQYPAVYAFYDGLGRQIQVKSPGEALAGREELRQTVGGIVKFNSRGQVKEKYLPYFVESSSLYTSPDYQTPHTSLEYDPMGRLVKSINPDGTYSTAKYSLWKTTTTDENGHSQTQYLDAYGRKTKIEEYNGALVYVTTYEYDVLGNLIKLIDNQKNITLINYDSLGRKIKMTDPDMGIWTYEYDVAGNLIKQTDAKGQKLIFAYDSLNRLVQKQGLSPQGTVPANLATYTYDDVTKNYCIGRLSKVSDTSGSTSFFYDKLGREIKTIKTIDSVQYAVQREYDNLDRLTKLIYPDGEAVSYEYDVNSGLLKKVEGLSPQGSVPYVKDITYTPTGQINTIKYGNDTSTAYTYDQKTLRLANLVTDSPQGKIQDLTYQFDKVGNIKSIADYVGTNNQSFVYDDLGRLIQAQGNYGSFGYSYDSIGNMIHKEGVSLSYGKLGKLVHAVTKFGSTLIDYDANGNMLKKGTLQYSYDLENRLTKVEDKPATAAAQTANITITLNPGWNFFSLPVLPADLKVSSVLAPISGKYQQLSRYNPSTKKFEHYVGITKYDQFNTLEYGRGYQIYIHGTGPVNLAVSGTLPLSKPVLLSTGTNLVFNPKNEEIPVETALLPLKINVNYTKVLYYNHTKEAFEEYSKAKKEFTVLKPGIAYYLYCPAACYWTVTNPPFSLGASFVYDGDGGRVRKGLSPQGTVPEQWTIYIGSLFEKDSDGTIRKHIFSGANRIATKGLSPKGTVPELSYYHPDHLGSSSVITNASGQRIASYEYTPYGTLARNETQGLSPQGTVPVHHLYTGKELDSTGLYFYGARYYDPQLGRFISADTLVQAPYDPQSLNRYSYCRNNPINYIDPTGHAFWAIFFAIAWSMAKGAAIGAAVGAAVSAATGQNILQGMMTGAISGTIFGGIGGLGLKGAAHTIAHTIGGAASGTANGAITGGDIGMNALIGGLSAGFSEKLGTFGPLRDVAGNSLGVHINNMLRHAFIGSVMGGATSAAMGGRFGYGAAQGAKTSAIAYVTNEAWHRGEELAGQAIEALNADAGKNIKAAFGGLNQVNKMAATKRDISYLKDLFAIDSQVSAKVPEGSYADINLYKNSVTNEVKFWSFKNEQVLYDPRSTNVIPHRVYGSMHAEPVEPQIRNSQNIYIND